MYQTAILGDCAYRDTACCESEAGDPPLTYHFCRSIFDWSCDPDVLVGHCGWQDMGKLEPDLSAVYVVEAEGAEFTKIGITDAPAWRLRGLQTSHWVELRLHSVMWVWEGKAKALEFLAHSVARKVTETRGEWVKMSAADAARTILQAAASMDLKVSGCAGVLATREDAVKSRAHALSTAKRVGAQQRAARLGF